jgi:hypothetical protein
VDAQSGHSTSPVKVFNARRRFIRSSSTVE